MVVWNALLPLQKAGWPPPYAYFTLLAERARMMNIIEKTPDEMAQVMSERLDNPSLRAKSREEDHGSSEVYAGFVLFNLVPVAYDYGFGVFVPLLLLLGTFCIISAWHVEASIWTAHRSLKYVPSRLGWILIHVGLAMGAALVLLV